jgi:hypothetical protein
VRCNIGTEEADMYRIENSPVKISGKIHQIVYSIQQKFRLHSYLRKRKERLGELNRLGRMRLRLRPLPGDKKSLPRKSPSTQKAS